MHIHNLFFWKHIERIIYIQLSYVQGLKKFTLQIKRKNLTEKSLHVQGLHNLCSKCWISDADSKIRAHLLTKQLGQSSFQSLRLANFHGNLDIW